MYDVALKAELPFQKHFLLVNSLPLRLVRISDASDTASGSALPPSHFQICEARVCKSAM